MGLSHKEQMFCLEYIVDLDANRARKASGLTVRADALLTKPEIKELIEELLIERARATRITAETVVTQLWENAMIAKEAKDIKASNYALELLGKHVGMWPKTAPKAGGITLQFGNPAPRPLEKDNAIETEGVDVEIEVDAPEEVEIDE